MLVLRIGGRLLTRTAGAIAQAGQLVFQPLERRVRGQTSNEPFGQGPEAMFCAVGRGMMVVAPSGHRFAALALTDDIVYLREPMLFAFEEALHWENGRIPGGDAEPIRVVQLRGSGRLVMRTRRAVFAVKLDPEETVYIDATALVGWIGRVVPRAVASEGAPVPYLECTGEGALLLEEPAAS